MNSKVQAHACSNSEGKPWNRHSEWTALDAAFILPPPFLSKCTTQPALQAGLQRHWPLPSRSCGFKGQGGSGLALLPPEPGVLLSELAKEQVTYENRPDNNTFDHLFLGKGDILNSKQHETQLLLSLPS